MSDSRRSMRKVLLRAILLVICLSVPLYCLYWVLIWPKPGWTKETVEKALATSLKPGVAKETVDQWMRSHGLEGWHYRKGPDGKFNGLGKGEQIQKFGSYTAVIISGQPRKWFHQEMIVVHFYFDEADILKEFKVTGSIVGI